MTQARWYQDAGAWRAIACGYLPWLAGLNLAWEIGQLPLYTLWTQASPAYLAFSVAHCTLGDVAVGTFTLALALVATDARSPAQWRYGLIAALTALAAASYTVFSEWMNTVWLESWAYSEWMPRLRLLGMEIGLTPLAQWLLLPPLALALARTKSRRGA